MVRIHHLTDTHFPNDDGALAAYVAAVRAGRFGPRPDVVVHTGDIVDGAADADGLARQLAGAREVLAGLGVPVHYACHSHDRFGESGFGRGKSFREVIGQDFLQHLALPGLDLFVVSGSITCHVPYHPCPDPPEPPSWGYDLFDFAVLREVDRLFGRARQPVRLLFYHLPIVPMLSAEQPADDALLAKLRRYGIGEEGRSRILPLLRTHGIRAVFGGHVHAHARRRCQGIEFRTTASLASGAVRGFREIVFDGARLRQRRLSLAGRSPTAA